MAVVAEIGQAVRKVSEVIADSHLDLIAWVT
jgi:hypothetical protein